MNGKDEAFSVFVSGLKNAHAMEREALSIMKPQVKRIENYPDLKQRLEAHIEETDGQISRLETIFDSIDESRSALKDAVLSMGGSMAALTHAAAADEILKDTFANYAFEHYEIAAYKSLQDLAERVQLTDAVPLIEQTLDQEQNMAQWIEDHIAQITDVYVQLRASDQTAKR